MLFKKRIVFNLCHNLLQKVMSFTEIEIVFVKKRCIEFIFGAWLKTKL